MLTYKQILIKRLKHYQDDLHRPFFHLNQMHTSKTFKSSFSLCLNNVGNNLNVQFKINTLYT